MALRAGVDSIATLTTGSFYGFANTFEEQSRLPDKTLEMLTLSAPAPLPSKNKSASELLLKKYPNRIINFSKD